MDLIRDLYGVDSKAFPLKLHFLIRFKIRWYYLMTPGDFPNNEWQMLDGVVDR